jgi:hypothetical protein
MLFTNIATPVKNPRATTIVQLDDFREIQRQYEHASETTADARSGVITLPYARTSGEKAHKNEATIPAATEPSKPLATKKHKIVPISATGMSMSRAMKIASRARVLLSSINALPNGTSERTDEFLEYIDQSTSTSIPK